MDFEETLNWLYSFQKFGVKLGLRRIRYIAKELGNPQENYKTILVGGTNGKYSVCNCLESILSENGYKVGVYTSPHLQHISERIVVDKVRIREDELISLAGNVKSIIEDMPCNDNPTFFEVLTALAFQYFDKKNIDFAVIEVGLGGRYDATNIINPMVSVITNVTKEHENILGKRIENIAFEKAGIIKNNVPVITAAEKKSLRIIKNVSKEKNAPIYVVHKSNINRVYGDSNGQKFMIKGLLKDYLLKTTMIGKHQGENIGLSLYAIENIQMSGVYISDVSINNGIIKVVNPGRMEIMSFNPIILLDGAHNKASIEVLKDVLNEDFCYSKLIVVLGILSDKDIKSILSIIVSIADVIIVTKSNSPRSCNPYDIKRKIRKLGFKSNVFVKDKVKDAVENAVLIARKNDLICVTGSLYTVGEARNYL